MMQTAHDQDDEFARIISSSTPELPSGNDRHRRSSSRFMDLIGKAAAVCVLLLVLATLSAGVVWLWRAVL